jgi:hypothetical protein
MPELLCLSLIGQVCAEDGWPSFEFGPMTAKPCEVTTALLNAPFVKSQRSGSRKFAPPPIPPGVGGNGLNVKSSFHPQPNLQQAELPKGGSEASLPWDQNAHLGGHWAGMWEHGAKVSEVVELHERTARPDDIVLRAFRRLGEDSGNVGAKVGCGAVWWR